MTDADLFSLLCREPFAGSLTWERYLGETDWRILHCYLAPRDEENHALIPLRVRMGRTRPDPEGATGDPDRAAQELPKAEDLGVPAEVFACNVPVSYILMFWAVWKRRGLNSETILEKFYSKLDECPPHGWVPRQRSA